jgi:hypothetical protein
MGTGDSGSSRPGPRNFLDARGQAAQTAGAEDRRADAGLLPKYRLESVRRISGFWRIDRLGRFFGLAIPFGRAIEASAGVARSREDGPLAAQPVPSLAQKRSECQSSKWCRSPRSGAESAAVVSRVMPAASSRAGTKTDPPRHCNLSHLLRRIRLGIGRRSTQQPWLLGEYRLVQP